MNPFLRSSWGAPNLHLRLPSHACQFSLQCRRIVLRQRTSTSSAENGNAPFKRYKSQSNSTTHAKRPQLGTDNDPANVVDVPIPLWYHRLGPVTSFFGWFNRTQQRRPLTVQFCTSLTIYLFGDLLAQRVEGAEYDPKRTLRNLVVGGLSSLPGYKWFLFLGNHFNYASKPLSIFVKVVINQSFFTPCFNTYFFGMQAFLSGASPEAILERIKKAVPESIKNSVKLWPAVTALTFWFIQPQYRFMTTGVVAVFWQSYLSWLNQREARKAGLIDNTVGIKQLTA